LLIFMLPVGLASGSKPLTATTVLFTSNLFIIGSGLPAPVSHAIMYGIYFCAGGLALVLSGYLQNFFFKNKYDLKHNQVIETNRIFTLNAKNLKFALKLSIAVCAANAIAGYLRLPQQYCAPMTALLILRADHESSIKRINHRLFGTLIGSILAGCLIVFIQDKLILAVLMLPIMFFIVVSMAKHYGAYVFFLTVLVTILFNLIEFNGFMVIIERILFTLLGIASVVTVVYLSKIMPRILNNFHK
ncbi:MAG TPA: FUSC family protein, partial [Aquella sp.]|nr:FUSC family protein [Aquella sp.]